jgi:hypothetical protein
VLVGSLTRSEQYYVGTFFVNEVVEPAALEIFSGSIQRGCRAGQDTFSKDAAFGVLVQVWVVWMNGNTTSILLSREEEVVGDNPS